MPLARPHNGSGRLQRPLVFPFYSTALAQHATAGATRTVRGQLVVSAKLLGQPLNFERGDARRAVKAPGRLVVHLRVTGGAVVLGWPRTLMR